MTRKSSTPKRTPAPKHKRQEQRGKGGKPPVLRRDQFKRELPKPTPAPAAPALSEATPLPEVVRHIRQLRSRTERERTRTFYIEGARIVMQAIQAGAAIQHGVIAPDLLTDTPHAVSTVAALRATGVPITQLSATEFEAISFKENLQGIGAVVRIQQQGLKSITPDMPQRWVALDGVGNPGNLGAIMRTCDAVGCTGLILLGDTVDPYHPLAIRASMGSFFALKMIRATFEEFSEWKKTQPASVIGTTPDVQQNYRDVTYPENYILLMGSERLGLSVFQQHICDVLVRIPMVGTCDSLNLGVATSLMLYELFEQARKNNPSA